MTIPVEFSAADIKVEMAPPFNVDVSVNGPPGPKGEPGEDGADGVSGSSGFIAQPEPPEDTSVLWLDTDEEPAPGGGGGGLDQATADTRYVNVDGDTMTGVLAMESEVYDDTYYRAGSIFVPGGEFRVMAGSTLAFRSDDISLEDESTGGPAVLHGVADPEVGTDAVNLQTLAAQISANPGPQGPQGPPGTAYMSAQWTFNQTITPPPASGGLRFNATTVAATTAVYISETDRDGLDRNAGLNAMVAGDQLMVQSAQGRAVFNVTTITDSGTYRTLGVTVAEFTGTRPNASAITTVYSITIGGGGGSAADSDQNILANQVFG